MKELVYTRLRGRIRKVWDGRRALFFSYARLAWLRRKRIFGVVFFFIVVIFELFVVVFWNFF